MTQESCVTHKALIFSYKHWPIPVMLRENSISTYDMGKTQNYLLILQDMGMGIATGQTNKQNKKSIWEKCGMVIKI
jgi:hypothetical protein